MTDPRKFSSLSISADPGDAAPALLVARDITKRYATRGSGYVHALDEVSFSLVDGEFVSVVGPSGCGKTTLMKLAAGLFPPSTGDMVYRGQPVKRAQRGMGIVFQTPVLLPWLTVLDNVLLPIRVLRLDRAQAEVRARGLLASVGLAGFEGTYPFELSGGMQQRVGIVRSLIHEPHLLLMDEPFGALDALSREQMNVELQRIWLTHRKTVFFITHSITEAVFLSDRVLVMSKRPGRIVKELAIPFDRPRDFAISTQADFGRYVHEIRQLLGGSNA